MPNEEFMINTPEGIRDYLRFGGLPGIRVIRPSTGGLQMAVTIDGTVKGGVNNNEEKSVQLNENKDLLIAQGLPPYAELTRLGGGFSVIAVAAIAGLVVRPTTVAAVTIWNGESPGGKSYVIDRLFTHGLVSSAATGYFGLWACIHPPGMAKPTADLPGSATNITGPSGNTYKGMAVVDVGATVVNNGWYPWGRGQGIAAAAVPGSHDEVEVAGRLIVPPQGAISLHVVASVVGDTFTSGASWYEHQLDLK